jgi:hypothetical protein
MGDTISSVVGSLLCGHARKDDNLQVVLQVPPFVVKVWGHAVAVVPAGKPQVVLLRPESTPVCLASRMRAEYEFTQAAKQLFRDGIEFYTVMHPEWPVPVLHWTLQRRKVRRK